MRILYVISGLGLGGAEKQLVELARQLSGRGHHVAIYTLTRHVPRAVDLAGAGVTIVVDQKRTKLDLRLLWRLRRMLARWRPDIVHGFLFDGDVYSRIAAFGSGIPVLNSERSDGYRLSRLQHLAHRLTRRCARAVVANTHSGASFAQRLFGLRSQDVHVVWNGIRVEELERQAANSVDYRTEFFGDRNVRIACLVGSIRPVKDYRLALEGAARLIEMDDRWRVLLIGDQPSSSGMYYNRDGPDRSAYKAEVLAHYERLGSTEKIRFCGLRTDVPAIVRQSDVLYVTSTHEGFPNAVLEAMALGVPVVSTEYSDIRRILPFAQQIVASRAPEDIAGAVLWAHTRREVIVRRQKQWVSANATIDRAATDLERVYVGYVRADRVAQSSNATVDAAACVASPRTERDR